jgi:regulator of sigma E protease
MADVNVAVRESAGRVLRIVVEKPDGLRHTAHIQVNPPGSIDASYNLVADDLLRVGGVVAEIDGAPTPASQTSLTDGSLITAAGGKSVSRWRELIDALRENAGSDLELNFLTKTGEQGTTKMPSPHCLRTRIGVGPEAQIVSIDGARTVRYDTPGGPGSYAIGYHKGIRERLRQLLAEGKTSARVEFRPDPLAELETKTVPIDENMIDPWLGRIAFSANIDVAPELVLLKGENAWEALRIGVHKTHYFILQVYTIMERMIFTRSVGLENISGPLGIIDMGGKVARASFVDFLFFMAMISANLAVINFLPLPIVDGGLMVFLIIEKIKGSPVSIKVQVATQMIGLFLIIGAFLFVTFNDAMRLWG